MHISRNLINSVLEPWTNTSENYDQTPLKNTRLENFKNRRVRLTDLALLPVLYSISLLSVLGHFIPLFVYTNDRANLCLALTPLMLPK